jgi:hypothetical protein
MFTRHDANTDGGDRQVAAAQSPMQVLVDAWIAAPFGGNAQ